MSEAATIGHNFPPVTIPKEEEMLGDLQRRYPEIEKDLGEFDKSFATFPDDIPLEHADVAERLQDLIGQAKKTKRTWSAHERGEKGPLNKLVKVVGNFFTKAEERIDALLAKYEPVHQAYLDKKKVETERKAREEADRQRAVEEENRRRADEAEAARKRADEEAAAARRRQEEETRRAEEAERDRRAAEERAALAKAEEERLAREKRERDRAEKERNTANLRSIRNYLKDAARLHALAEAEEASDEEIRILDILIRHGGTIGLLARPVAESALLDDEQRAAVENVRTELATMRAAAIDRMGKREAKRRQKEADEAAAREAAAAEERKKVREAEEASLAEARKRREAEEAAAALAREEQKKAEAAAREARDQARGAEREGKQQAKVAEKAEEQADRAGNRADRTESRLENMTDADKSRTRGDYGTVGSLVRRWVHYITDEDALREAIIVQCKSSEIAALLSQLGSSDLNGAVYRYMRMHQDGWRGRERVDDALAGCLFAYEQEARVV